MRTALAVGLGWPERLASGVGPLDCHPGPLEFGPPDLETFPCLPGAQALRAGGTAPATLNAANEVAVSAFLRGRIGFLSIAALVEDALAAIAVEPAASLEALRGIDARARRHAEQAIATGAIR